MAGNFEAQETYPWFKEFADMLGVRVENLQPSLENWFSLLAGKRIPRGGDIPKFPIKTSEFYWRHKFSDADLAESVLVLLALNGDGVAFVSPRKILWIQHESMDCLEPYESLEDLSKGIVLRVRSGLVFDSRSQNKR